MPKTKISEFSATPGNNTDIDGINIAEGCPPSGINDAIRELMAQLKDFQAGTAGDSFNGPVGTTTPAAGAFTNLSASGTFALTGDQVQISEGGTGQTTANAAFNALAPSQSTHAGKYLKTDGTNTSWDALDISTADITGTLPIANGGTGLTALGTGVQTALGQNVTGSGGIVLASSPSLTTPNLGTPSAVTLTNATGLPLSTGVTGTLATTNGGTGLTSFSANQVFYASSTSAVAQSSNLQFSGTDLTVYGVTVGRGAGAQVETTVVGNGALASNSTGNQNTAIGFSALTTSTAGVANAAVGAYALRYFTGSYNIAVGVQSMQGVNGSSTGSNNTAIGHQSLYSNTTASNNTAVGYQAGYSNVTGAGSVFLGTQAGYAATLSQGVHIGYSAGYRSSGNQVIYIGYTAGPNTATLGTESNNVGIGWAALTSTTSGSNNIAIGTQALQANTTASNNTAVGYQAGYSNTTGAGQTFLGYQAGYSATTGSFNLFAGERSGYSNTTGERNVALGYTALNVNSTGVRNVAVGMSALEQTTGSYNIGIGYQALVSNTTADNNTAVGYQAGYSNQTASGMTTVGYQAGYANTSVAIDAFGYQALKANTTGSSNVALGVLSAQANTSGSYNTAVGREALYSNTTASLNTAVGYQAMYSNTTGTSNAALGYQALYSNTTSSQNTAVGRLAMYANTGSSNTGIGHLALYENTSGQYNTSVGDQALRLNTTASWNTAVGYQALYTNTTGTENVAIGPSALYAVTTGYENIGIGRGAGSGLTTAIRNTFIGDDAGYFITTGSSNTIIGRYSGNQGGLDIRTASNYIVLSDGDGNPLISTNSTRSVALNGAVPQTGTGITFPATQNASSDANTLDDYEEGTFTATLKGSTTDPTTPVTSTAKYTKIGNVVYIQITFDGVNTTGASGNITVTSLPFTPATGHRCIGAVFSSNMATFTGTMVSTIDNNLTTVYFYGISSNAANGAVTHNAGTSRTLHVTGFYYV